MTDLSCGQVCLWCKRCHCIFATAVAAFSWLALCTAEGAGCEQTPQLSLSTDPATARPQSLPGSRPDRAQERPRAQQPAKRGSLPEDAALRGQSLMPAAPAGVSIDEQRRKALEAILKVCSHAYAHVRHPEESAYLAAA